MEQYDDTTGAIEKTVDSTADGRPEKPKENVAINLPSISEISNNPFESSVLNRSGSSVLSCEYSYNDLCTVITAYDKRFVGVMNSPSSFGTIHHNCLDSTDCHNNGFASSTRNSDQPVLPTSAGICSTLPALNVSTDAITGAVATHPLGYERPMCREYNVTPPLRSTTLVGLAAGSSGATFSTKKPAGISSVKKSILKSAKIVLAEPSTLQTGLFASYTVTCVAYVAYIFIFVW